MRAKIIRNNSYTNLENELNVVLHDLEIDPECEVRDVKFTVHMEVSMGTGDDMVFYYALVLYD